MDAFLRLFRLLIINPALVGIAMLKFCKQFFLVFLVVGSLFGCAAHRLAGTGEPTSNNGYALITIKSNMSGILPFNPDDFWGMPLILELAPEKTYLVQMKSGVYKLGTIASGMSVGWGTFNKMPFTIAPGKVVYLGEHIFMRGSGMKYSWAVVDALDKSLASLSPAEIKEISGLPVERALPKKNN